MKFNRHFVRKGNVINVDYEFQLGVAKFGDHYTILIFDKDKCYDIKMQQCDTEEEFDKKIEQLEENISYEIYKDGKLWCTFQDYNEAERYCDNNPGCVMDSIRDPNPNFPFKI